MRTNWMLLGLVFASTANAAHPPLFKPDAPATWTWNQQQRANRALDVLFDKCPAIAKWLPDIKGASMHVDDLSSPANAMEAPLFKPFGWNKALVVTIYTVAKPQSPIFNNYEGPIDVDFYLGTGVKPGIVMQGGFFPQAACGAHSKTAFRWEYDRSSDKAEDPDAFIPAPALRLLDQI